MLEFIVAFLVGVGIIIIGVINIKGNISMMHKYHRKRVSEEDRIPFGKQVGLGSIIMGASVCVASVISAIEFYTKITVLTWISTGVLVVGFAIGLVLIFRAMIKYNKGVF